MRSAFQGGAIAGNGAGQTIAIVSAYDAPTIGSDLKKFDSQFGLPNPPSFLKYYQPGVTRRDAGWALETALDVEWAHAMAPGANLVLVEARSASLGDLFNAVNFARSLSGVSAVTMSWGTGEFFGENAYDSLFSTPAGHVGGGGLPGGISFVAASGDTGAWSGVSYPAASPNVLSVGATSLSLGAGAAYSGESGWTDSTGGFSALEPAPAYQLSAQVASGLSYGLRTVPDVAAVGDPSTGVSVYDSFSYAGRSGWLTVGGTSASAPQWAGLIAVADQGLALAGRGSLANAQSALYVISSSAFHNVASGFNGYSASSGYDLVTGLGTPIASQVVAGLTSQTVASEGGLSLGSVPHAASSFTAHAFFVLASDSSQGTNTGSGSTSSSSSTATPPPVVVSPPVVVIIPIGSSRVVVFFPPVVEPGWPFASSSHLVESFSSTSIELANPIFSPLSKFGQGGMMDSLTWLRTLRSSPDAEVAAVIDLVEPFQASGSGSCCATEGRLPAFRASAQRLALLRDVALPADARRESDRSDEPIQVAHRGGRLPSHPAHATASPRG